VAEIPVDGEGIEWLINVASHAAEFFAATRDPMIAASVGKPEASGQTARLTIKDFIDYLGMKSGQDEWRRAMRIMRVLHAMHGSMLLLEDGFAGGSLFGRVYVTADLATDAQSGSHLYLSHVLGAALIIPTYAAITIPIPGIYPDTKDAGVGSGIVLSDRYILTNRHVVVDMQVDDEIPTPASAPPGVKLWPEMAPTVRVLDTKPHSDEHLDVAIIEVEPLEGTKGLNSLSGLAFRDPVWGDETYVLGYPPVPTSDGAYLAVQQGIVVDPAHEDGQRSHPFTAQHGEVVAPSVGSYMTETRYFYYSAVTRPGNSGGPVVAQDGRVVGIVAHSTHEKGGYASGFYRGIPTREIARALIDLLGSTSPITMEDWSYSGAQPTGY
jgi:S1-C subfamily serine protease